MRRVLLMALLGAVLSGCGRDSEDGLTTINAEDRELGKIKSVVIRGGCFGCHNVEEHRFGPSWRAVSERYKDDPEAVANLTESIQYGSGGKWSDVVGNNVMPPNEKRVNGSETKQVIEYILSL